MSNDWYVQLMGDEIGPLSDQQLRELARSKRIAPDSLIRKGASGSWLTADRVRGLFRPAVTRRPGVQRREQPPPSEPSVAPSSAPRDERSEPPELPPFRTTKTCPFCAEDIARKAVKCKHCGEFLDQAARQHSWTERQISSAGTPGPNSGVAAVLSLLIPGAGQFTKVRLGLG